jgi:hypothetical protein
MWSLHVCHRPLFLNLIYISCIWYSSIKKSSSCAQQHFFLPGCTLVSRRKSAWLTDLLLDPEAMTGRTKLRKDPFVIYFLCKISAALVNSSIYAHIQGQCSILF